MSIRFFFAVLAGKSCRALTRLQGSGGGAFPGLVAERFYPEILKDFSQQCQAGVVLVSGTNGKTTTCRLLASLLSTVYPNQVHNRSGSNMSRGHISAFLDKCSWTGKVKADLAILEVDEAVLPRVLKLTQAKTVLLHNLFRDQLDRYGEVDSIAKKWLAGLKESLPQKSTLIINADDANLAYLAQQSGHSQVTYYGLDPQGFDQSQPTSTIDAYLSPASGQPLIYRNYFLSHLGDYQDPASDFRRPQPQISANNIQLSGPNIPSQFDFQPSNTNPSQTISLTLPGLYNIYNALAALTAALTLGLKESAIPNSLGDTESAFGRFEHLEIKGNSLTFCLIKNPVGATEVIRTITLDPQPFNLGLFANDNFADGLDVSWYWDSNFEAIAKRPAILYCGGKRGLDMAVRLKYAGFKNELITTTTIEEGLNKIITTPSEKPTYILATYTATLEIQNLLAKQGWKTAYWKE